MRIDVVISDQLESQLRMEVFKRYGGRKGDLSKAVAEAIELWIKNPVIEKLKKKAIDGSLSTTELSELVDTLTTMGKASLPALGDILNITNLSTTEMTKILEGIRLVTKG